jgi:FkbM family methyltransferase
MAQPPDEAPPHPAFRQIAKRLPQWQASVIVDVGANVGQSALGFARAWPEATIHCFEPVPATHAQLVANTAHLPSIIAHPVGLANRSGLHRMSDRENSTTNRVLPDESTEGIEVNLAKGADLMTDLALSRISFLKIDTEGHDLEALKGFGPALTQIDFIQVEAGMNAYNRTHVPFGRLTAHLERNGFLLFHILEQVFEFKKGGRPVLRRANPVYINGDMVDLTGIR